MFSFSFMIDDGSSNELYCFNDVSTRDAIADMAVRLIRSIRTRLLGEDVEVTELIWEPAWDDEMERIVFEARMRNAWEASMGPALLVPGSTADPETMEE